MIRAVIVDAPRETVAQAAAVPVSVGDRRVGVTGSGETAHSVQPGIRANPNLYRNGAAHGRAMHQPPLW
jgi:hypothetical protein